MKYTNLKIIFIFVLFIYILFGNSTSYAMYYFEISGEKTIEVGKTLQLKFLQVFYNDAITPDTPAGETDRKDITEQAHWTSSNPSIATISDSGLITAIAPGTVTIKATQDYDERVCTYEILVKETTETPSTPQEQWTDFSNLQIEIKKSTGALIAYNAISFKNINYIPGHSYYVYFSNSSTKPSEYTSIITNGNFSDYNFDKFLEKSGNIYLWIIESYNGKEKTVVDTKQITRPVQNPLGQRIVGSFFGTSSIISFNEPMHSENRKVKIKIGTINNTTILKKLKNNQFSALTDLLSYAKSAESISEKTIPAGISQEILVYPELFTENAYYYVYYVADEEDGKYFPVEDVAFFQYKYYTSNNGQLLDVNNEDFTWTLEDTTTSSPPSTPNPSNDPTTATTVLPDTGLNFLILIIIFAIVSAIMFSFIKYNNLKDIK